MLNISNFALLVAFAGNQLTIGFSIRYRDLLTKVSFTPGRFLVRVIWTKEGTEGGSLRYI